MSLTAFIASFSLYGAGEGVISFPGWNTHFDLLGNDASSVHGST